MKDDIRKTLETCYSRRAGMDSPEYYVTPEYRHYREKLAETARDAHLLSALDRIVREVFPNREMTSVVDLVSSPEIRYVQYPSEEFISDEASHALMLHISGLGPFWHLEVVTFEAIDEEFIDQFVESDIPKPILPEYRELQKRMKELGYREVTAEETWEPVRGYNLAYVEPEHHRVGHLLFCRESPFGVENFDDILLGMEDIESEVAGMLGLDEERDLDEQLAQIFTAPGEEDEDWENGEDDEEDDDEVTLH